MGTLLPRSFLDSDDDWQEGFRAKWYPRFHPYLELVGGYGIGTVGSNQYVGYTKLDEETLEEELVDLGFVRNPISCYKHGPDGRPSTGSWVLLAEDSKRIDPGMQLHVTLFLKGDEDGVDIFAHYEDDWRTAPLAHLREKNFQPEYGASLARSIFDKNSFVDF